MAPRINIPPVTRILLVVLFLQSFLSAAVRYRQRSADAIVFVPYLVLVPQLSLTYPWTFVTTTLVEGNIFTLALAAATLYHGGRYLERAWSGAELAKFLVVVSLVPNLCCFFLLISFFAISRSEGWTLTPVSGTVPLQIAFLVAFSQLVPAHTVTVFRGLVSLRVPRFPLVHLGLVTLLALTPVFSVVHFLLAAFGFLTSWTYLRFYKKVFPDLDSSQPSSLRGDASETFAFAEFFPAPAKPAVAAVSAHVFAVLVSLRLCTPFSPADLPAAGGGDGFLRRGAPGSARAEAERRRALALKALDQRLHAATANAIPRAAGAAGIPQPQVPQPAHHTAGPTVHTQSVPNVQTAMTFQPGPMLGETSYDPDNDGKSGA